MSGKITRTEADFEKFAVIGLAIHNARSAWQKACVECERASERDISASMMYPEVQEYTLWVVNPAVEVTCLASSPTSADFAQFIKKGNLAALGRKYKAIGFLSCRRIRKPRKDEELQCDPLAVPKLRGGAL
jgi:hypothetical protein